MEKKLVTDTIVASRVTDNLASCISRNIEDGNNTLIILDSDRLFFANSNTIRPESKLVIDNILDTSLANSNIRVEIEGHTDSTGIAKFNMLLSQKRAESIYKYAKLCGADTTRLYYHGSGYYQPIADNQSEEGRRANRRIEILINELNR